MFNSRKARFCRAFALVAKGCPAPRHAHSPWIHTMLRCAFVALATALLAQSAAAQVQRNFPVNAWRGEISFGPAPEALLNGQPARLAPAVRVRGTNNMTVTPASVIGQKFLVHYTLEVPTGLIKEVWILREDEAAKKPWPRSAKEAEQLRFDAAAQTWSKP
jgi:hypothetical protein